MKKFFGLLLLCLLLSTTAWAQVRTETEQGSKYKLTYPVFTLTNARATAAINKELALLAVEARQLSQEKEVWEVSTSYEIISENDEFISLIFTTWSYRGGAHGSYYTMGLVYDKTTGLPLPYTHFKPQLQAAQLKQDILDGRLTVYCADMKSISTAPFLADTENFQVSDNYIVTADGSVYLLYQPYELDCYAAGATFVKLP